GYEAAKSQGEYGIQIRDTELRTGLAAKEVGQFRFAMKAAGSDISATESLMRGLTNAITDNSSQGEKARLTLNRIGVSPRDSSGELRPTGELLLSISEGLNSIPNALERNRAGLDIFKKA